MLLKKSRLTIGVSFCSPAEDHDTLVVTGALLVVTRRIVSTSFLLLLVRHLLLLPWHLLLLGTRS